MSDDSVPLFHSPWAHRLSSLAASFDSSILDLTESSGGSIVNLLARKGQEDALRDRIDKLFGVALPGRPQCAASAHFQIIGTGPGSWLAVHADEPAGWAERLSSDLAAVAAVVDQSSSYAILTIGGARASDLLAKGAFIDLHPDAFPPGAVAVTSIAHMDVILWRLDENLTYRLAIFRSSAESFIDWIAANAAAYEVDLLR